jgi:hypothetical protein
LTVILPTAILSSVGIRTVHHHTEQKPTMAMTPVERKAEFKRAVTLKQTTMEKAAVEDLRVSFHHLSEVLAGRRVGSEELEQRFAEYIGLSRDEVFPPRAVVAA